MYETHAADCRKGRVRAPLAWPYHCFQRSADGSRTHSKPLCRRLPCRLAPAPILSSAHARSRTWSSTFAGSRANPPHSEDVSSNQSRRLDLHQHRAVSGTAAKRWSAATFLNRATSASRSARSRTPLGGFGDRFLSQEDTPVIGPRPCRSRLPDGTLTGRGPRSRPAGGTYSRSVTFQYASLMNFDQLAIRTSWSA
jgi:hypothetical protein